MPPTTQINIRRDTAANFTSANPTLALGEIAYETDTFRFKVGTGSTAWTALGYAAQNPTSLTVTGTTASTSTTTGALTVAGGVGIGGALNTGGNAVVNSIKVGTGTAAAPNTNTVVGANAGNIMQAGADFNACFGVNAGYSLTTGDFNTFIGGQAGVSASGTSQNTAVGYGALQSGTGSGNTAVGSLALFTTTGGSFCTAVGGAALANNRASDLVAVGHEALDANTLGTGNVALGRAALGAATTAIGTFTTTPVAAGSGYTANQTGVTVTLVKKSGADTFTGTVQAALTTNASGAVTAVAATPVSAGSTFTGSNVIFEPSGFGGAGCEISIATLTSAANNTAVGHTALAANTTGPSNTAVGHQALLYHQTGSSNTGIGQGALSNLVSGSLNTAVGQGALNAQTGNNAVGVGRNTLVSASNAESSLALGTEAGRYIGSGTVACTVATNSTFIGTDARPSADSQTNQIVIGYQGRGSGSNTTTIGNSSTTDTYLAGDVTINGDDIFGGTVVGGQRSYNSLTFGGGAPSLNLMRSSTNQISVGVSGSSPFNGFVGSTNNTGLIVQTNGVARMTFAGNANGVTIPAGNLIIGTAGNGIDFSADAHATGMTSELLDDYEEGTWTPTIAFGGGSTGLTFSTRVARYCKIGNVVTISARINLSAKGTSTGDATFGNLPFTVVNDTATIYAGSPIIFNATFADVPYFVISQNSTTGTFYEVTKAGALTNLTNADFTDTTNIILTATYFTA